MAVISLDSIDLCRLLDLPDPIAADPLRVPEDFTVGALGLDQDLFAVGDKLAAELLQERG